MSLKIEEQLMKEVILHTRGRNKMPIRVRCSFATNEYDKQIDENLDEEIYKLVMCSNNK